MRSYSSSGWLFVSLALITLALATFLPINTYAQENSPDQQSNPLNSEPPEANPSRPTVATPATLTPVGYLQFESGWLGAADSPEFSTRHGFNEVVRLTINPRVELIAPAEPFVHYRATRSLPASNGTGDVFLGAQVVLFRGENARPTIAVGYSRHVYDGATPDIDIGSARDSFLLAASADVYGFHYDANALFNEQTAGPLNRFQSGQTISISHPLTTRFSLTGELWHFTQPFTSSNAAGNLWALGYAPRPNLVFDAGFNRGLTSTSTQWELFAGFTYLLPRRLW